MIAIAEHILLEFALRVYLFEGYLASCSAVFPDLFLRARSAPGAVIRSPITSAFPSKICCQQLLSDDDHSIPFSAAIWSGVLPSVFWIARLAPCAAVSAATTSKLPSQKCEIIFGWSSKCFYTLFCSNMECGAAIAVDCVDVDASEQQKLSDGAQVTW